MAAMSNKNWLKQFANIRGFLLDIYGVCYDSVDGVKIPIPGSIEAVKTLKERGVPVRFCTNTTTQTKSHLLSELQRLGFSVNHSDVFAPAPAAMQMIKQKGLRPHLLVHPDVMAEFEGADKNNPNCVVLGDAQSAFSYEALNKAFHVLMSMENPLFIAMGLGKYYKEDGVLQLDVGSFAKLLEFATGVKPIVVGKPDPTFFNAALEDMGLTTKEAVMIGDDIVNDVGGAQASGLMGLQVRTGKYRPQDEPHPTVTPDGYIDNLKEAVDLYFENRK